MTVRVAVGDPQAISVDFPGVATGDVSVSVFSTRLETTQGPFVATNVGGGIYSYMLTSSMASLVDELRLTFMGTVAGVAYSRKEWVEIAGAHYFGIAEARAVGRIEATFSDDEIAKQRAAVEDQIEANCDTSFVARYVEQRTAGRGQFIRLSENYVLNLIKAVEDDVDVTSEVELDGRYVWRNPTSASVSLGEWSSGHRNVLLKYEAGYDETPPSDLRRKAIQAVRANLLVERRQGLPPQAVTIGTEAGTLRLAVAGLRQPFGIPDIDAVVLKWARRVCVPVAGT